MKTVSLPTGEPVPVLGLGTWRIGESDRLRRQEVAAVRLALEMGYRLVDTAEMYGEGGAEQVLGQALQEALRAGTLQREQLVVVSKVYPHNASRAGIAAACDRSRRRLGLDCIDIYLLHWRGPHRLAETVAGFEALCSKGHIRHWGVSNFDTADLIELQGVAGGSACATNQVFYALSERGPEFDLLPWQRAQAMPMMAYSPIDQGALAGHAELGAIGESHGATASQVALAWVLARPGVVAIPKAVREDHLRENLAAATLQLGADDHAEIDRHFPAPRRKASLAMR